MIEPVALPAPVIEWIERNIGAGARTTRAWPLRGGRSSEMHAVDVRDARGFTRELVLRRIVNRRWIEAEPDLALREAAALAVAGPTGLVPRVVAVDPAGEACGAPAVLSERLPGTVDLSPQDRDGWLQQLAEVLARVHDLPADDPRFPPAERWFDAEARAVPRWTREPAAWQRLIDVARSTPPTAGETFLHRDYHPGNILWQDGRLTAVVDWPNASIGSRSVDLGHCRDNLALLFNVSVAERFLAMYVALTGHEHDVLGDIETLLDKGDSPDVVAWHAQGRTDLTAGHITRRRDEYAVYLARQIA